MKKIITPLLVIGAGFVAWKYFFKAYVGTKVLNIKVRGLKLNPISQASVIVEITNPSNQPININSMSFDISLDGYAVGTLNYLKGAVIKQDSTTSINIPFQINPLESLTFLPYLISQRFKVKTISLKGSVHGEGFVIPIEITQNVNG